MDLREEIKRIAETKLVDPAHFIVDVIVSSKKGPKKVLVILDGDNGVGIDDCAKMSRELSDELEEATYLEENYTLEVSTPGLDQPLVLKRQYIKNIGRGLKVKTGDQVLEGKLSAVGENNITLEQEIGTGKKKEIKAVEVDFSQIDKAFVLVSFK